VWIEGADDLTQEAQAFLRRILETSSKNVVCALEVRELWKMSPPVLSRCTVIQMKNDMSYRINKKYGLAHSLGLLNNTQPNYETITWRDIPALRRSGADPYKLFNTIIDNKGIDLDKDAIKALRAIGAGSSSWIQLTLYLMRLEEQSEAQTLN
jgi:DNA polymerase III delta prime subunit